jgi:TonB family protein
MRALCIAGMLFWPLMHAVCQDPRNSLAHYRSAETYFEQKDYISAANEFREALNGDLEPQWIEAASHLRLGKIFEITGQHDRAVNEFALAEGSAALPIAKPIQRTDPEYTDEARLAELEGTVVLVGTIDPDGFARDLQVGQLLGLGLDEKAIDAASQWHFPPSLNHARSQIQVDFRLSSKQSRWHLIRVQFDTPPGISRPVFLNAQYPIGAGLGPEAMEEGRLVAAMRRLATARLTFDVDQHGLPVNLQTQAASDSVWGIEATAVVGQWRFTPATQNAIAAPAHCTVDLVWGARELDFSKLALVRQAMDEKTAAPSDAVSRSTVEPNQMQATRITVPARVQATKLVSWAPPEYPSAAGATDLRGMVRLRVLIGVDGRVLQAEALDGDPVLINAASDAVKQWMYLPTLLNGTAVEVTSEADVDVGPH